MPDTRTRPCSSLKPMRLTPAASVTTTLWNGTGRPVRSTNSTSTHASPVGAGGCVGVTTELAACALHSERTNAEPPALAALIVAACDVPAPPESPTRTVGQPTITIPRCAVMSEIRTTGRPSAITVIEPFVRTSGGPTQIAMSPTTDTGAPPAHTVTAPGPTTGPPTCGIGTTAGVCIGQR